MRTLIPNHLTECGRIYAFVNQDNANFVIIICLLCNDEYCDWLTFHNHLQNHHIQKFQINQQSKNMEIKNNKSEVEEHLKNEFQLEFPTETQTKTYGIKAAYIKNKLSCQGNEAKDEKQMSVEDFKYISEDDFAEECITGNFGDNCNTNLKHDVKTESSKPITTCFFRICATKPQIMLKFIELLRRHPCQWDHKNNNFNHKSKRVESTLHLTKQLNKYFNLNITPQGTRASVLSLMRWFDREYIRFLTCTQKGFQFVSMHNEYFDKLLEFLPHQHLNPMNCDECSRRFKSEHLLMAHKHKHHNGQVPFRCRYCGHGFIHQSSHKMHENRHVKIHMWPCNICLYQAVSKSDYIKHLATHSSNQPYKCDICGLSYKTKTNLNVHRKSHSLPEYECEICKKKFYEKYRYKRHIWLHEKEQAFSKSIDNYTCEICGRRFTSNKTLMKHQTVHIQENYKVGDQKDECHSLKNVIVYYCDYCSLEFIYKKAYEDHMDLKHNINIK